MNNPLNFVNGLQTLRITGIMNEQDVHFFAHVSFFMED